MEDFQVSLHLTQKKRKFADPGQQKRSIDNYVPGELLAVPNARFYGINTFSLMCQVDDPKRGPGTVGLVMERKRREGEEDGLMWFCEKCNAPLFEKKFKLTNIMTQFQETFAQFYGSVDLRTCKKCGAVMEPPVPP